MATLKEYFETDFKFNITAGQELTIRGAGREAKVNVRVHFDFNSGTKFISYYVPVCVEPLDLFLLLLNPPYLAASENLSGGLSPFAQIGFPGEELMHSRDLKFSGRVFIYSENSLSEQELSTLKVAAKQRGLSMQFRGPNFAEQRSATEKPLAFISHDSRDKKDVALPLTLELQKKGCPVWYDEFALKVGDSLRESIEKGIKECKRCILVLSPNFLSNGGWTKVEFNSVFTREIIEQKNIVLPVWYNVTKQQVYEYSSSLPNKKG
ncbi:MAG: toll/interleukin-1 receptor domain-containing protein [Pyrinomonadaceae bacterium]|nr:toll/interleukin-1 receptor domain-containing protein [Pyrinomonadaceae bacterium]